MDRLQAIQAFARVVETGSFARAAQRLDVSTSAVSRHVAELEAHLDARLLNRTTRRLSLTEAGQSFYEHSVQLLADLEDAEASVRVATHAPKGTLRLSCGVSFGLRYLAPVLRDFCGRHGDVVVDLDLSDRTVDLVEEGFDMAIRIGRMGQQGLVSRRLGSTQVVCCAAPAYLASVRERLETPDDLARHRCLCYTNVGLPNVWRFQPRDGDADPIDIRITPWHRSNSGQLLAKLAVQGLGIVYSPDFIVAESIRAGQLVPLLTSYLPARSPIAAVYPSRRHLSATVRTFVDFVAARFEKDHPWSLEGFVPTAAAS
jgi:DNA-binding transcriptional LysR family regulator